MKTSMQTCRICGKEKPKHAFRRRSDNGKHRTECRDCERERSKPNATPSVKISPKELTKAQLEHRMFIGASSRAAHKKLPFNLQEGDINIPAICPVLKIPLVSNGPMTDNSPTLDRMLPHLGYTKGNVKVISNLANRIKTNANSIQLEAVLRYVKEIEENT